MPQRRLLAATGAALLLAGAGPAQPSVQGESRIAVGEYLVAVGGCNDCHTQGWNQSPGKVPAALRLTGSRIGWSGPWGTSYPTNLRLLVRGMTADQWVGLLATMQPRPPTPWFNLRAMSEADQRAIYAYIRGLGPAGEPAPAALRPGEAPRTPWLDAVPRAGS